MALFGCGHRTVHQKDLHQLDVACRKFLRAVVGPPSNIDWSRPWHEILHDWNGKAQSVTLEHGMKLWSHQSLASYWKVAMHFASVPHDRWIQRILSWMPDGRHTAGCPRHNWATRLSAFVRFLQMDEWQVLAHDTAFWLPPHGRECVCVCVRVRPACQNRQPFQAQARTTNDIYISSSTDFSERNKVIELINPKGCVVGTMCPMSPISYLFVPAKRLNH